jgi:putative two-component system response regulator
LFAADQLQELHIVLPLGPRPVIVSVDDDPIILNSILATLKPEHDVRPFTSAKTALQYLERQSADLILLDYYLPDMLGTDILKILQSEPRFRDIPVVFLTMSMDDKSEIEALEMGAVDYIFKPIKPQVLLARVHMQLELHRYRHHLEALVDEKTQQLLYANNKLHQRNKTMFDLLARASDLRDHDTGAHVVRTTEYARIIVEHLLDQPVDGYELTSVEGADIIEATKLHDIGKIAMPDQVLLKPSKLTPEEFAIIKTHTIYGESMLQSVISDADDFLLLTARDIVQYHHERWDGSGYSHGIAGKNIPLSARIAAIADVFDALTSVRPYKAAFSAREAFDIMYKESGSHFDPYLIEIMKLHESDFTAIYDSQTLVF